MARQRRSQGDAEVVVKRGVLNEARWEQILQAAAEEFDKKGYKAARLQDIAARVGLLTGSLYYYIESKESLLFALVDSAHRRRLDTTVADADAATDRAPDRLREFIHRQVEALADAQSAALTVVDRDRKYLTAEHRAQVEEMRAELRAFVNGVLSQGVMDGDFDPTVDIELATNSLLELVNSTSQLASESHGSSPSAIADWCARLFLRGLAPSESRWNGLDAPREATRHGGGGKSVAAVGRSHRDG
jgi:AcrR family transcriptional regulator